jgi:hypothetical protein
MLGSSTPPTIHATGTFRPAIESSRRRFWPGCITSTASCRRRRRGASSRIIADHSPQRLGARQQSSVGIVSVVSFANTVWRCKRVVAPYVLLFRVVIVGVLADTRLDELGVVQRVLRHARRCEFG